MSGKDNEERRNESFLLSAVFSVRLIPLSDPIAG